MARAVLLSVVCSVLLIGCALPFHSAKSKPHLVSRKERDANIGRAQIWAKTDIASMDLRRGPKRDGFGPDDTVTCHYVKKDFGGDTPKFGCQRDGDDDVMKVRYGRDNGEVYANVAATRILWALGFGADAVYPVRVVCQGCPQKMAREGTRDGDAITFDIAAIEHKFPGHDIDAHNEDPGWAWADLDKIDESSGGAPTSERDALKLLAVFLQHTDNKSDQQRLVCLTKEPPETGECHDPFMMIHDVGQTFGRANLFDRALLGSVNFERWSTTPIWDDAKRCIGNLAPSERGTLTDPIISEGGRTFLSGLLAQLTDQQLQDVFSVARFDRKPHGGAPVDDWVAAFKHKREEIAAVECR
jgi:hypothetical protein